MLRSGFFNSLGSDKRKYYNADISRLFNSLINDGVFQNVGQCLMVEPNIRMSVNVQPGLAYFNSTWIYNDADYIVNIDAAPIVEGYNRIDGIFLKMLDENDFGDRENTIYYMAGQAGSQPVRPVPSVVGEEKYIPLCYINVTTNLSAITAANITNCVGVTTTTPFVSGILKTIEATELFAQWSAQFNEYIINRQNAFDEWQQGQESDFATWSAQEKALYEQWESDSKDDFDEWFANLQYILDGDVAGHLQVEIDNIVTGALVTTEEM